MKARDSDWATMRSGENAGTWYLAELRINIHQVSICLSINMEFIKLDLKVFKT